ncbi:long-chain fatty acid--CoA ligase [Myxococcota bacterium]|nr:long-chain fatty acid--CoA ligase [Myxococcota bacterium]
MSRTDTLVHRLADLAARRGDQVALREPAPGGGFTERTWRDYRDHSREIAAGLLALGHEPGECVALVGDNRIDWVLCELGIMSVRGIPAPIYTTLLHEQAAWIVDHAQARIAICDGRAQLDKLRTAWDQGLLPRLERIVTMDALEVDDPRVSSLAALRAAGRASDPARLQARVDTVSPDETALLIYTSGTTGLPKAVQLDHRGMLMVADGLLQRVPGVNDPEQYAVVSYLPLCHVAEQIFTTMLHLSTGGRVTFCADMARIKEALLDVRPTVFLGVPRVWEKFQAALSARFAEATGLKARLLAWARQAELEAFRAQVATGVPQAGLARKLARALVLDKVRAALGLDRLVIAATGAAPIALETLEFFASIGIVVLEGYGMSETSGVATSSDPSRPRFGTVGQTLPGVELRIAEDGEILLRGRSMTRGYLRQPEQTAELLDDQGWLHTGDLGSVDAEGFLRITGRKKDIIITAGGKNVAPAEMEGFIKQIPGVAQAVVVGDRQPYLGALVTLNPETLAELAQAAGVPLGPPAALAADPRVQAWLQEQVERCCNQKVARYQTIKKVRILEADFSVEGGELTPTMKVKRNVVSERYRQEIDSLFA